MTDDGAAYRAQFCERQGREHDYAEAEPDPRDPKRMDIFRCQRCPAVYWQPAYR